MQSGQTPQTKDYFADLQAPNIEQMKLELEGLVQQGTLSPEQAQAILVDKSAMEDIQTDPGLQAAQMDALTGLQDISGGGGMTAMDRAKLNQIQQDEATQQRGAREAIIQNAEARGMGGSGLEMLSQMQNQQDSATRQSTRDLDVAGMAQQRALDALMKGGQLAGDIRGQGFGEQAAKAGATDAIAKFNAQNQQQVGLTNTAANNTAAASNLATKQGVADANAGTRNAQQQYNKGLVQQDYENKVKKATGQTGVSQANAALQQKAQESDQGFLGGLISTGGKVAATLSDERAKEDVEHFDASEFLDTLTPSKFRYKDPRHGEGDRVGVMAQDLEKSDTGASLVSESPEGKTVDYAKAAPAILASVASLNERIKKLERGEG